MKTWRVNSALNSRLLPRFIVLLLLVTLILWAKQLAIDLPTYHLDGAFQTASGLYRLHAGQLPGRDFFPYLGIGPLYSLWPVFELAGGNLAASVFAARCLTIVCGVITMAAMAQWLLQPRSAYWTLCWAALVYSVAIVIFIPNGIHVPDWLEFFITPGNSLKPIRAFGPVIALGMTYWVAQSDRLSESQARYCVALIAAVCALWSNDFSYISVFILFIFYCATHWMKHKSIAHAMRSTFFLFLLAAAMWVCLFALLTHDHLDKILIYNFSDVLHDQWWYFAPYSNKSRVLHLSELGKLYDSDLSWFLSATVLASLNLARRRDARSLAVLLLGLAFFGGGFTASVGGHIGGYFHPARFWATLVVYYYLWHVVSTWAGRRVLFQSLPSHFIRAQNVIASCAVIAAVSLSAIQYTNWNAASKHAQTDESRFLVPELGGYLSQDWQAYAELARQNSEAAVAEEYWGIWSAINRVFPPWPVDSLIHALGSVRQLASQQVNRPDYLITTRFEVSSVWQPWGFSTNYWFYREILDHYQLIGSGPSTYVWKRGRSGMSRTIAECNVLNNGHKFSISGSVGLYEVELEYLAQKSNRTVVLVKNNISFGVDMPGYVSINQSATSAVFPVYAPRAGSTLFGSMVNEDRSGLSITACHATRMDGVAREIFDYPQKWNWRGCNLYTEVGSIHTDGCYISSDGLQRSGTLAFGPYVVLDEGHYRFNVNYSAHGPATSEVGSWDVFSAFDTGNIPFPSDRLYGTEDAIHSFHGEFEIPHDTEMLPMEVRVFTNKHTKVSVHSLNIERLK
jgi:hypothetical protein